MAKGLGSTCPTQADEVNVKPQGARSPARFPGRDLDRVEIVPAVQRGVDAPVEAGTGAGYHGAQL